MTTLSRRQASGLLFAATALAAVPAWAREPLSEARHWQLGFATAPPELDGELTRLEGRLPPELEGTLYRVGPAQFDRGGETLGHWFDGDGMVQCFAIAGGRVSHRGRFVATPKREAEQAAGRFLFSGYGFNPRNAGPTRRADDLNAANTSVLPIADEIWALWEGGSPWRLDPATLETRGRRAFAGPLDGAPFSAHPKRDQNGDIWNFGAFGSRCVLWRLGPDGEVRDSTLIELPQASLMHDFAITERHVVLLLPPMLVVPGARGDTILDHYAWRDDQPLQALVLDKQDLTRRRIFEMPARFLFHIGNAWEDASGTIHLDACTASDASFATQTARDLPQGRYVAGPSAAPTMITLHADGRAETANLAGVAEFPRIDPRRVSLEHRYTYGVIQNGIARWDWRTGRRTHFHYGADHWAEEPIFVPRAGGSGEADGWIIATALNMRAGRTELFALEAARLDDGPLAHFACSYPLPLGFHGAFVTEPF